MKRGFVGFFPFVVAGCHGEWKYKKAEGLDR